MVRAWIGITTFALLAGKLVFVTVNPIVDAVNHVIEPARTRKIVTMIELVKKKEGNVSTIQTSAHLVVIRAGSAADQLIYETYYMTHNLFSYGLCWKFISMRWRSKYRWHRGSTSIKLQSFGRSCNWFQFGHTKWLVQWRLSQLGNQFLCEMFHR